MTEDCERDDDVFDLYEIDDEFYIKEVNENTSSPRKGERTPTKMSNPTSAMNTSTPRRSPRNHPQKDEQTLINVSVFQLVITDLTGVDPRIDVPTTLIIANETSTDVHTASKLLTCLKDTGALRNSITFDLCRDN